MKRAISRTRYLKIQRNCKGTHEMMRPCFRSSIVSLGLCLALLTTTAAVHADQSPPNIVLIFVDDMGYADIEPFGNDQVRTPQLNRLAAEGRKFTSFYAAPVCTMSRTNLLTGCYNPRVSMPGVLFPGSDKALHPDEVTFAEIAKSQGYATACVGKWHLGDRPAFFPLAQGFDEYFGLPYSNDMVGGRKNKQFGIMPPLPVIRGNDTIETEPDQSQLTKRYTSEAVRFIDSHQDEPFLLYLPHTMVHFPLAASDDFRGKSPMGLIGDTIEEIDWSVGEILRVLDETGLRENTVVMFTSDNGPAKRDAPPLRGNKGSNFEGGVRVPTIMRWPNRIPAATSCDQICGTIDVLPTIAALVGAEPAADRTIDGQDITSLLLESDPKAVRETHLYYNGTGTLAAIRHGDWKLAVGSLQGKATKPGALFNLHDDIGETSDVSAENPDVVQQLRQIATEMDADVQNNSRPAAKVH
ncbi:MAG: sulfatase [Pirellulaceae bacterium]